MLQEETMVQDTIRRFGPDDAPPMLFVSGFGDVGDVFEPLSKTALAERYRLVTFDMPGCGRAAPLATPTTLDALADVVLDVASRERARVVAGHSIGSVTASLAMRKPASEIATMISLEGNLTEHDAYFSGSAADYDQPEAFHRAFLGKLAEMATDDPQIERYRQTIEIADPKALWHVGRDVRAFSAEQAPIEVLIEVGAAAYIYNPENCAPQSLDRLARSAIPSFRLDGASHWASLDQPEALAASILEALGAA